MGSNQTNGASNSNTVVDSNISNGHKIRIVIVGDVHGDWNPVADEAALKYLNVDVCLFVGDFGNENVTIVEQIASLELPKAVILGNHDCWNLTVPLEIDKPKNRVGRQLRCLGETHVGYSSLSFPSLQLTVVGARPFSQGGNCNKWQMAVLDHLYGVQTMQESADLIVENVCKVPKDHTVVLMGHNGPIGLGTSAFDICGADFRQGGDWGDLDLRLALEQLRQVGRMPALVAFGHMHEQLRFGGNRRMIRMDQNKQTTFLNTAVVPRECQKLNDVQHVNSTLRHFCVVEIEDGTVRSAENVWVAVTHEGNILEVAVRQPLIKYDESGSKLIYDGNLSKWEQIQQQVDVEIEPALQKN